MTRKAVVMARGLGTRMQSKRPGPELGPEGQRLARQGLKMLVPLGGRPFLDYVVDSLLRSGLQRICLVIAPGADLMRQHARRIAEAAGVTVDCAVQEEPRGTADAVLAAEEFAGEDAFVLCNADNLYPDKALRRLADLDDGDCYLAAFSSEDLVRHGNIPAERVKDFAAVTAAADGRLLGIVEKPSDPEQYAQDGKVWVSMNLYRFTPAIFGACRQVTPDPDRGELELTAAVAGLVAAGDATVRVLLCEGGVLDLTRPTDIMSAGDALEGRRLCF
ncbi:MAG: nucleotidyltransferase family protein [Planctomycetota bacterium]